MLDLKVVHAEPPAGSRTSSCCGRTLAEMDPSDWLSRDHGQVTCGRLTEADELLLLGGSATGNERVLFDLAIGIRHLCGPAVSLQSAYDKVSSIVGELAAGRPEKRYWFA
jgi:hypothetical protein